MKVCILTHVFVRKRKDSLVPFMINFAKAVSNQVVDLHVICPHNKGFKKKKNENSIS